MTSSEMGAAQQYPAPALPSPPGHDHHDEDPQHRHHHHHQQQEEQEQPAHDAPYRASSDPPEAAFRAIRSTFPLSHQNGEDVMEVANAMEAAHAMEVSNVTNFSASEKHFRGGAWKDDWVVSLIHLRGSMDEEFAKPQKPGIDMWSRVSSQLAKAHEDFDKNSESCQKKWGFLFCCRNHIVIKNKYAE